MRYWGHSVFTVKHRIPLKADRSKAVVCCGSLLPVFGVRVSVTFHLMCVHITFSSVRLLSGHLLGNSCSLG